MNSILHVFPNGMRMVYLENPGEISHCGLLIGAGSRDEPKGKDGLAHFIEHVLFKGTKKRKAYQVLNRLEIVGGELNAYTTKEETCVHASMLHAHLERAVELITDIVFHSQFPEKEIEKEKEVVIDEIHSYLDSPAEQIYDDFECLVFRGQPLGNPVLGTPESVRTFTKKDITGFIKKNYSNTKIIFTYTGSLPFDYVKAIASKYLENEGQKTVTVLPVKFRSLSNKKLIQTRTAAHAHYILGNVAYSGYSNKRFPLFLLNNILGGPGMNSRLNMNVREKYGYTYHIESAYMPFRDTGLFNVYFASEKKYLDKCITLVEKEFTKLKSNKISASWLTRYKYQLKGQIAIAQENKAGVMLNNAKNVLNYNKPLNIPEVFRKIDAITSEQVLEVANEILNTSKMSSLLYKPLE